MKSRITITLDFENGNEPIIEIDQRFTNDVRDHMVKAFLERLGGQSSWCRIDHIAGLNDSNLIRIRPLWPSELSDQAKLMAAVAQLAEERATTPV